MEPRTNPQLTKEALLIAIVCVPLLTSGLSVDEIYDRVLLQCEGNTVLAHLVCFILAEVAR